MNETQTTPRYFTGPGKLRAALTFLREGCQELATGDQDVDLVEMEAAYQLVGRPWQQRANDVATLRKHQDMDFQLKEICAGHSIRQLIEQRDQARQNVANAKQAKAAAEQRYDNASHLNQQMRLIEQRNLELFASLDTICGPESQRGEAGKDNKGEGGQNPWDLAN